MNELIDKALRDVEMLIYKEHSLLLSCYDKLQLKRILENLTYDTRSAKNSNS